MVVRWVHRSSFTIRPPAGGKQLRLVVPRDVGPGPAPGGAWLIDSDWFGTVVVEAEGTNEGLADLQARCGGAFPPRAVGASFSPERAARAEAQRSVFRILREKRCVILLTPATLRRAASRAESMCQRADAGLQPARRDLDSNRDREGEASAALGSSMMVHRGALKPQKTSVEAFPRALRLCGAVACCVLC